MRIVKLPEFRKLRVGTIFAFYGGHDDDVLHRYHGKDGKFGIKYAPLSGFWASAITEHSALFEHYERAHKDHSIELPYSPDRVLTIDTFDDEELFMIYPPDDIERLVKVLLSAPGMKKNG